MTASSIAALVAMGAVLIFMAVVYGFFGIIANVALLLNIAMIFALLSIIGATLTLPGIAGLVLTIGMAVDANVLIFARIREELRAGLTPQQAIKAGYERAFVTILDANITTFIDTLLAAVLLRNPAAFTIVLVEMVSIALVSIAILATTYHRYERGMLSFVGWLTSNNCNLASFMFAIFVLPLILMLL